MSYYRIRLVMFYFREPVCAIRYVWMSVKLTRAVELTCLQK